MLHSHPVERDRGTRTCLVSPLPLLPPLELPVAGSAARRRGYVISQPPPIASSLSSLFPSLTMPLWNFPPLSGDVARPKFETLTPTAEEFAWPRVSGFAHL